MSAQKTVRWGVQCIVYCTITIQKYKIVVQIKIILLVVQKKQRNNRLHHLWECPPLSSNTFSQVRVWLAPESRSTGAGESVMARSFCEGDAVRASNLLSLECFPHFRGSSDGAAAVDCVGFGPGCAETARGRRGRLGFALLAGVRG